MKHLRLVSCLVMIAMLAGTSQLIGARAPVALAQSGDLGVFGFGQTDWDDSFTFIEHRSDGIAIYQLNDGGGLYVRFDDAGNTIYVEYQLGASLAFSDMESFVLGELMPGDAEPAARYQDVMVGSHIEHRFTVQLYASDTVSQLLPEYSGIILVAFHQDGLNFSVSVG